MIRMGRGAAAGIAVAMVLGATAIADAGPTQDGSALPTPTITPSPAHEGDRVTVRGSGCTRPGGEPATGLRVTISRPRNMGRGGVFYESVARVDVAADGTYEGSFVASQPLPESGEHLQVVCSGAPTGDRTVLAPIHYVSPSLPDMFGTVGGGVAVRMPCTLEHTMYDGAALVLVRSGNDLVSDIRDVLPDGTATEGQVIVFPTPVDLRAGEPLTPGVYDGQFTCGGGEGNGPHGYYAHFKVTIAAGDATPAAPRSGQPGYTG